VLQEGRKYTSIHASPGVIWRIPVKASGGTMDGEPHAFGNTGMMIGIAVGPARQSH
jgi:hypothetical protein